MINRSLPCLATVAVVAACAFAPLAAHATPNLVTNGDFESVTNGTGEIIPGKTTGTYITSATGWYSTATTANGGAPFLFVASNAVTGFGDAWDNGIRSLWGSANGGVSSWNGTSPVGGNFLVMDGDYHATPISQAISGLTVGTTYALSFSWGAGQWFNANGNTTESLTASLGGQSGTTQTIQLASHDFSGWMNQTLYFTYTGGSNVLSFLAGGGPSGEPPMVVLDGVSLAAVPEPTTMALLLTGLVGAITVARRRKPGHDAKMV